MNDTLRAQNLGGKNKGSKTKVGEEEERKQSLLKLQLKLSKEIEESLMAMCEVSEELKHIK